MALTIKLKLYFYIKCIICYCCIKTRHNIHLAILTVLVDTISVRLVGGSWWGMFVGRWWFVGG